MATLPNNGTNSEKYRPKGSPAHKRKLIQMRQWWKENRSEERLARKRESAKGRLRRRTPEQKIQHTEEGRRLREQRKANGLCFSCGRVPPAEGILSCRSCQDRRNARNTAIKAAGGKAYEEKLAYHRQQTKLSKFKRYGITHEDYTALLINQGGCCAICGSNNPQQKNHGRFSIDHSHKAEEESGSIVIRGLLCSSCNTALGLFRDNPTLLRKAAGYLEAAPQMEIERAS